ncbi:hypothetical protein AYL99_07251 [Fonsecaea erecta]|uniref:BZIP domain-containing protein n=1 Tax=Fonsecaea erecta TaxID=1367422 RepID=A0A178ZF90_9EURO|nr:hypothetical protein AYL99_07251 [Fonsecaea erecta]OAP58161.1 hypothetical protein AYL99_07251 [Fonsecaea erecta]
MHCTDLPSAPCRKREAGQNERLKGAITEARRQQNRRAQRAFRERRRTKKQPPPSTTPRLLAPCPREARGDITITSSKTEILDRLRSATHPEPLTPSSSHQALRGRTHDRQYPGSRSTTDVPFTFSCPQTLLPTHQSFISKRSTPFTELLDLVRDSPRAALWPHGVTTTIAACLFNARALGIDLERVMDPHYMSPFYQASLSPTLLSSGSSIQPTNHSNTSASDVPLAIPVPLRPCSAQVIFPHHVCLDMLPLPRLRETAVMLDVRSQQGREVSGAASAAQELKQDVYLRQGVRFRGTGELIGGEYVMYDHDSDRHCGHPWERGSWAVAPWFTRKWLLFVGDHI